MGCPLVLVAVEKLRTVSAFAVELGSRPTDDDLVSPALEATRMIGEQCRSESLFYYLRIEDHVPEHHLLRLVDRYVSLDFCAREAESLLQRYWATIDPERLLRILLIGYLYGITSGRKLIEELSNASCLALVDRPRVRSRSAKPFRCGGTLLSTSGKKLFNLDRFTYRA